MHSETSIWIEAPSRDLFDLVSDLDRWKSILPHYRYVRILSRHDGTTHAAMSARRGPIPVFWEALQTADPRTRTIRFRHVRGITRGMEVLWSFTDERGGTRARVDHDLDFKVPVVGRWFADVTRPLMVHSRLGTASLHAIPLALGVIVTLVGWWLARSVPRRRRKKVPEHV